MFILSYLKKMANLLFTFFFFIAIFGNTASPVLKLKLFKKAHKQVIAVRIAHLVRETQKIS